MGTEEKKKYIRKWIDDKATDKWIELVYSFVKNLRTK